MNQIIENIVQEKGLTFRGDRVSEDCRNYSNKGIWLETCFDSDAKKFYVNIGGRQSKKVEEAVDDLKSTIIKAIAESYQNYSVDFDWLGLEQRLRDQTNKL